MDAVSASLAVGTRKKAGRRSQKNGKFLRDGRIIERERRALELLRYGHTHAEIGTALEISRSAASNLIARALAHRAESEGPTVEAARELHRGRLEEMLSAWYPRAVGHWMDPETGESEHPPDYRAADMTLKILGQMADIMGTRKIIPVRQPLDNDGSPSTGGVHVHFHHPAERMSAEAAILDGLRKYSEKQNTIEGQLASIGTSTSELLGETTNDKPGPPPVRT